MRYLYKEYSEKVLLIDDQCEAVYQEIEKIRNAMKIPNANLFELQAELEKKYYEGKKLRDKKARRMKKEDNDKKMK